MKLTINEEAVKHYHYGNSGESRRKEVADRFGFDFTPDDHMITCKDGKVINIQLGKKYRCTSCNNQRVEIVDIDELFDDGSAMLDVAWRNKRHTVSSTQIYESVLREKDVEIDVKHEGILEVPEGKNVNDLPMSHFEKLAKKKGLGKITKALNNLQVWNKNDDPELSKWAGNMIDKLNKKLKKDESKISYKESAHKSYWKYDVESPVLNEDDEDETYLTKYDIRRVKLIQCENPEDCYDSDRYWAVCNYEYPYNEFYGTKNDAYDMLLTCINNSIFERINDI